MCHSFHSFLRSDMSTTHGNSVCAHNCCIRVLHTYHPSVVSCSFLSLAELFLDLTYPTPPCTILRIVMGSTSFEMAPMHFVVAVMVGCHTHLCVYISPECYCRMSIINNYAYMTLILLYMFFKHVNPSKWCGFIIIGGHGMMHSH